MIDRCVICGSALMSAVQCRLHHGSVHQEHCKECFYFEELSWHCSYYHQHIAPAKEAAELAKMKQEKEERKAKKQKNIKETWQHRKEMIIQWAAEHNIKIPKNK